MLNYFNCIIFILFLNGFFHLDDVMVKVFCLASNLLKDLTMTIHFANSTKKTFLQSLCTILPAIPVSSSVGCETKYKTLSLLATHC